MNVNGRSLRDQLPSLVSDTQPDTDSLPAPDRAGVNSRTQCYGLILEAAEGKTLDTPQGLVSAITILYGAIEPEIVFAGPAIRFVYGTVDGKRHEVTIRGMGEKLKLIHRMISIGKRESIRVTGDSATAIEWEEV